MTGPAQRQVKRELAASYEGLGDLLSQKDELPQSLKNYELALTLRRQLVDEEPANVEFRRELAGLYSHLGDLKGMPGSSNLGDMPGALAAHRESLHLREELAASEPKNHDFQFGLASGLSSVGFLSNATGDTKGAIELLGRSIVLLEALCTAEPTNVRYRMELETEYMRIGSVLFDDGQYATAIDLTRRTIRSVESRLTDAESSRTQYSLGIAYNFLGRNLTRSGDISAALEAHAHALAINEKLAEADPASAEMKRGLWLTHQRTAEAYFAGRDFPSALAGYRRAVAMEESLLNSAPDNAQAREDHSIGLAGLGMTLSELGDLVAAQDNLRRAKVEAETLAAQSPSNSRLQTRLALRLFEYGHISAQLAQRSPRGDAAASWRAARELLSRSLEIFNTLRTQNKLSRVDAGKSDEVMKEIASCENALAGI